MRLPIDKRYLGIRIGLRVGAVTQEQAEERLRVEMTRIEYERERKLHARPTFIRFTTDHWNHSSRIA